MHLLNFLKYLKLKLDKKLTGLSKFLFVIYLLSMFIPILNGDMRQFTLVQNVLMCYITSVTFLGFALVLWLMVSYFEFLSQEDTTPPNCFLIVLLLLGLPTLSIITSLVFGILTPLHFTVWFPILIILAIYFGEWVSNLPFTLSKFYKFFFKEE